MSTARKTYLTVGKVAFHACGAVAMLVCLIAGFGHDNWLSQFLDGYPNLWAVMILMAIAWEIVMGGLFLV